ncbi:unnamed protein product [Knipowitschia caucasica]|uniref:C-type lectin domain-containing protein n=1 Tax=Knipowitschia caucasica TaxID=637954 RepID=A0AAV2K7P5_KNICA
MSCNIYEEPNNLTEPVRYSRAPLNQNREERVVEIYESSYNGQLVPRQVLNRPQTWFSQNTDRLKLISSGLGLICVIQLFVIAFLTYYCIQGKEKSADNQDDKKPAPGPGLCPEHWTRFHCSCLSVFLEKKTWNLSRADCEQKGADLIVVDSKEKKDFVQNLTTELKQDLWIGLYKHNGVWTWINDVALTGHRAWMVGVSPDHAAEGSSAFLAEDGNWDYVQEGQKGYVCELKL